jgi:hypothetical protein
LTGLDRTDLPLGGGAGLAGLADRLGRPDAAVEDGQDDQGDDVRQGVDELVGRNDTSRKVLRACVQPNSRQDRATPTTGQLPRISAASAMNPRPWFMFSVY